MHFGTRACVALIAVGLWLGPAGAAPLFKLSPDGRHFEYAARPGDHPTRVAELFGITGRDFDAFLAANRIEDATRIDPGFVFRIPNPVATQAETLKAENSRLAAEASSATARAAAFEKELQQLRVDTRAAEERAARLASFEWRWPLARAALVVLGLLAAAAAAVAVAAARRQRESERYARGLAIDLEEKRKSNLAERQESGRHILDLEGRIRTLEAQLGPRVVVSNR
jgi:hypothetical protein